MRGRVVVSHAGPRRAVARLVAPAGEPVAVAAVYQLAETAARVAVGIGADGGRAAAMEADFRSALFESHRAASPPLVAEAVADGDRGRVAVSVDVRSHDGTPIARVLLRWHVVARAALAA